MKLIDRFIAMFFVQMRSALELQRLNGIWERFNAGEDVLEEIVSYKWKYHKDKVVLLVEIHYYRKS